MKETFIFTPDDWEAFVGAVNKYREASDVVSAYIVGDAGGHPDRMTEEQLAAESAHSDMSEAFYRLKELAYHMLKCQPDTTYHMNISMDAVKNGVADYRKPVFAIADGD